MRWWLNRRRRTGGVSVSDTVDTTNGRQHNVGTAAARTAGRGRDEAQSLAATICQRRPSDQLTPSHRPQLDSDACERQHSARSLDDFGRHSVQQRHTHGWQRVSSPVRQLRLTRSRPYTPADTHSDSQSDNFVDDYWVTIIHPLSSAA